MLNLPFSLKNKVSPDNFVALWPTYSAATASAKPLADGVKPKSMWDFPAMHGVTACRQQMLAMGISPFDAASYGSRLSLVQTVLSEPEIQNRFKNWIRFNGETSEPTEPLLRAIAVANINSQGGFGVMLDFDDLERILGGQHA